MFDHHQLIAVATKLDPIIAEVKSLAATMLTDTDHTTEQFEQVLGLGKLIEDRRDAIIRYVRDADTRATAEAAAVKPTKLNLPPPNLGLPKPKPNG